ncbi:MAG TPA: TonB-dependent receptor [Rubricoccaceae bacterium]
MKPFATLLFVALAVLLGAAAPTAAQTGKIAGVITDATTGETLIGATVRVEGLSAGAATDIDGAYQIIGVRPGQYAVTVSYVGYQTQRVENVVVRIDLTTTVSVALAEETLGGGEVVVEADRELFQQDVTATTASVSGDEIRSIPVENFQDVVALQAGVVGSGNDAHFRGGRAGEVGYWIDGVPVSDVYNGGLSVSLENESVQELQVVTGAFNAEYGQALSGIVNVVTRDGTNDVTGEVEVWAGDYAAATSATSAGIDAPGLELFPGNGVSEFNPLGVQNLEGAISGPIVRDRLFFFTSGRYFSNDGYYFGRDLFDGGDITLDPGTGALLFVNEDGTTTADGGAFATDSALTAAPLTALNPYEKLSGQFKLSAALAGGLRLSGNLFVSREDYRDFNFGYLYFPTASRENHRAARTGIFKLTHVFSNRTFYEVGLTNNYSRFENYLFADPLDARYRDNDLFGQRAPSLFTSDFALGGTDNGRFQRTTNTWLAKVDVSSQVHPAHLLKTGIEARRHDLFYNDQFTLVEETFNDDGTVTPDATPQLVTNGTYNYQPVEFAAYVQDKVEVGGLIINAGLRLDYFDSNGVVFGDPTDPATVFANLRECVNVSEGVCVPNAEGVIEYRENPYTPDELFDDAGSTFQISPRLGVAFPITEGGVVHFSYGQFFQTPNFELLYQNPYFQLSSAGSGLVGLIGNANLQPEQTINGEIGLKQELTSNSAIELTAYYRDIRNLAGTATDPIQIAGTSARYGRLVNSDFGVVRGVIFRYDQRVGRDLYAGVDYTYQVARANASDPALAYNALAGDALLDRSIVRTDWDQRHTANASLTYNSTRFNGGFGVIASYGSGSPYTPSNQAATLNGSNPPSVVVLNSSTRPSSFNINFNAYRNFQVTSGTNIQVYAKVDNVLDTRNETNIFGDTGRATYALLPNSDLGTYTGAPLLLEQRYVRPDFFSQPRRVVLGLRFQF